MRLTALILAILTGVACVVFGVIFDWIESAAPEALAVGIMLLASSGVAWKTGRFRFLAATWGLFLGFWTVFVELLAVMSRSKGFVDVTPVNDMAVVFAVSLIALAGLVSSLVAPARDP